MFSLTPVVWRVCLVLLITTVALSLYHWTRSAQGLAPGEPSWVPWSNMHRDDGSRYTEAGRRHMRLSILFRMLSIPLAAVVWWGR